MLGKPAKNQSHYRPSGSGVISLGRKRTGGTLSYLRDGRTIEITLLENGVGYVRSPPLKRGQVLIFYSGARAGVGPRPRSRRKEGQDRGSKRPWKKRRAGGS